VTGGADRDVPAREEGSRERSIDVRVPLTGERERVSRVAALAHGSQFAAVRILVTARALGPHACEPPCGTVTCGKVLRGHGVARLTSNGGVLARQRELRGGVLKRLHRKLRRDHAMAALAANADLPQVHVRVARRAGLTGFCEADSQNRLRYRASCWSHDRAAG